jgi:hypothetical protein
LINSFQVDAQYIYGFASKNVNNFDFKGVEYKSKVFVNRTAESITLKIFDSLNQLVSTQEILFENLPNLNSISFYNSIGLFQTQDGLYLKDFITNKKVYITRDRYNEEMPAGKFNPELTKYNELIIYDRFLNEIKLIDLKAYSKNGKYWAMLYDKVEFSTNKVSLLLNYPLKDGQASYQRSSDKYLFDMITNKFSPSLTIQIQQTNSSNKQTNSSNICPDNFKEISNNEILGTARKYKATNGKYYYEVKLTISPNVITKRYTTKIEAKRIQESKNVEIGLTKTVNVISGSSGTFTFKGCFETDKFEIEGFYSCKTGRFSGPSATVNFRDLKIIQ